MVTQYLRFGGPRGNVIPSLLSGVCVVGIVTGGFMLSPKEPYTVLPLTSSEVVAGLNTTGLSAEAMAAAGLSPAQVQQAVSGLIDHMEENIAAIRQVSSQYDQQKRLHDRLDDRARQGLATAEEAAMRTSGAGALSSAGQALDAARAAMRAAALNGLSAGQVAALEALQRNAKWEVPMKYRVIDRTEQEWVALRDALANVRISADDGEDSDAACRDLVLAADSAAAVATAEVGLTNARATIEQALLEAVADGVD